MLFLRRTLLGVFLVLSLWFGPSTQAADKPFEWPDYYSLEYKQTTPEGVSTVKHYVRGSKVRVESPDAPGGPGVEIFDVDTDTGRKIPRLFDTDGAWQEISRDTDSVKYKISYEGAEKPVFVWLSTLVSMPVKMAREDGSLTADVRNFMPSPPSSSLFEPQAGADGA